MKSILVLTLLDVAGSGARVMAQSPGTITATGDMSTERQSHTATLLTNGKVLIAGGDAILGSGVIGTGRLIPAKASAELYDPATRAFTSTGSMTVARRGHTATLLPDGKVLIAGGNDLPGAELFDPSTAAFAATGEMTTGTGSHTATLLNNGKVLITAAHSRAGGWTARAELYDPFTGTFAATGEPTLGSRSATLLSNGKVLFEGSPFDDDTPVGNELYDPDTGTFSPTGGKANPHSCPMAASLLMTGEVLVTSTDCNNPGGFAEVYDPSAATFTATWGFNRYRRTYATATLLPDGKVLIAGRDYDSYPNGSAELYDPATGRFSTTGVTRREEGHRATLLPDGTVLLSGGWICCGFSVATAEIYRPAVLTPAPALFSFRQDGREQGAIWHATTGQVASPANPASGGDVLAMYTTSLFEGGVIPPQVSIGGRLAEVLFFGNAPGFPGVNQVNFRVPAGVVAGSAVPVRLTYLGRPSNEVTAGVR